MCHKYRSMISIDRIIDKKRKQTMKIINKKSFFFSIRLTNQLSPCFILFDLVFSFSFVKNFTSTTDLSKDFLPTLLLSHSVDSFHAGRCISICSHQKQRVNIRDRNRNESLRALRYLFEYRYRIRSETIETSNISALFMDLRNS